MRSKRKRDTELSSWNILLSDIINGVVNVLKATRRWRKDGPKLRLLNRHWRAQVDSCVTVVHPHSTRKLSGRDLVSLNKFPNLSFLNLERFCQGRSPDRCARVISQLPSVTRLTVPLKFIRGVSSAPLARLNKVTQLRIEPHSINQHIEMNKETIDSVLLKLECLNLEELCLDCKNGLVPPSSAELTKLAKLKSLRLTVWKPPSVEEGGFLSWIEALHLTVVFRFQVGTCMGRWSNLVSLDLRHVEENDFSALVVCGRLRHLKLTIRSNMEPHQAVLPPCVVAKLETLWLEATNFGEDGWILDHALSQSVELKSLYLAGFLVTAQEISFFPHLSELRLKSCSLLDVAFWITTLSQLESLSLFSQTASTELLAALSHRELPQLRQLLFKYDTLASPQVFRSVKALTRLESLGLCSAVAAAGDHGGIICNLLEVIRGLECLTELGLCEDIFDAIGAALSDPALLDRLEALWVQGTMHHKRRRSVVEELHRRAPDLRINYSPSALESLESRNNSGEQ